MKTIISDGLNKTITSTQDWKYADETIIKYEKEIERLNNIIKEALNYIYKNYGVLDKYQIEILETILKGE